MRFFQNFAACWLWAICAALSCAAGELPVFDFRDPQTAKEWGNPHHISSLRPTAEGLEIHISDHDPFFHGPARDYPTNTLLWLIAEVKSGQSGTAEIFYFKEHATAGQSVKFHVHGGRAAEVRVPMPALGPGFRLRFDPPGTQGKVLLQRLRFEPRVLLPEPEFPAWARPEPGDQLRLTSGPLQLFTSAANPLAAELRVAGESMAVTHPAPRIGYLMSNQVRWVEMRDASVRQRFGRLEISSRALDADGGEWLYSQSYRAAKTGTLESTTKVSVSQDREVVFLPLHLLFAGEQSFGIHKGQGLLAGLEYLDDEPSSSEADIIGPESRRRVPSSHKITFPLMAIQANDSYVGLVWDEPRKFSPLFDSPDRTFGSGGHAMGLLFPGTETSPREEGNLLPYHGARVRAGEAILSRALIIGGRGGSVVPAIQHYHQLRALPETPETGLNLDGYVALTSHGWLRSKLREGKLYRHAFWPGFGPMPAADAAVFETWLAAFARKPEAAAELMAAADEALSAVSPGNYYHSAVGHVRLPVAPLLFGSIPEAMDAAKQNARAQLARFKPDGSVPYTPKADGPDYSKTHFADDANGLTAQVVATLLDAAIFSGDRALISEALEKLRTLDRFRNTVPRGAQTWEVPLHTPDILASAHLVRAYTLGYELTGNDEFLRQAKHWGWAGVPFVYLHNPTGEPVGPYSTIAVLGATSWREPVWFGRPVQWCGMVYADALYRLAKHDTKSPWRRLADGITAAGLQHTWREDDPERAGLLPDFYELREQLRAGPAINPGTIGVSAARFFGQGPMHDFVALQKSGIIIHAPGEIVVKEDTTARARIEVTAWPARSYTILATGFAAPPELVVDGKRVEAQFHLASGAITIPMDGSKSGKRKIEIRR